jgi:hypothetical protein
MKMTLLALPNPGTATDFLAARVRAGLLEREQVGEGQPEDAGPADAEEIAAGDAVAVAFRRRTGDDEHGRDSAQECGEGKREPGAPAPRFW